MASSFLKYLCKRFALGGKLGGSHRQTNENETSAQSEKNDACPYAGETRPFLPQGRRKAGEFAHSRPARKRDGAKGRETVLHRRGREKRFVREHKTIFDYFSPHRINSTFSRVISYCLGVWPFHLSKPLTVALFHFSPFALPPIVRLVSQTTPDPCFPPCRTPL